MILLGFELEENQLPVPIPILTLSPLPIQVPNPIKVKKSSALILEDLKKQQKHMLI